MKLKIFLCKLLFLIFIFLFYNNAFSFTINKKNIKNFIFLKHNQYFRFLKYKKYFFSKKEKILINNKYFGFLEENKFKIFYIVKPKDTLYSISKDSGYNSYELSKFNLIKKPYKIFTGQKIWIGDFLINKNKDNCYIIQYYKNNQKKYTVCSKIFNKTFNIKKFLKNYIQNSDTSTKICLSCDKEFKNYQNYLKKKSFTFSNNWYWPVNSMYVQYFYNHQEDSQQIEIFGFKGQPIFAASAGEVVCVTDIYKKYGRLIIIRHNNNYLSIYAFNNSILVKQGDQVYAKQKIATMGLSDKHSARLYFEIRYKGESISPLKVLPDIYTRK